MVVVACSLADLPIAVDDVQAGGDVERRVSPVLALLDHAAETPAGREVGDDCKDQQL